MSDLEAQLRWKGQLGANPKPPCQHSCRKRPERRPDIDGVFVIILCTFMYNFSFREQSTRLAQVNFISNLFSADDLLPDHLSGFIFPGVFGQLGLGAVKKQSRPKLVEEIAHEKVQLLCCGSFETVSFRR